MPNDDWRTYPLERPHARQVGMPRRFGVGVLMILTALFAVLSSVLAVFGVPPVGFAAVGVFFVGVAVAQAVLYGGKKPRRASVFAGSVLLPVEMAAVLAYENGNLMDVAGLLVDPCGLLCTAIGGAVWGYLAGFVTATVFLVMNRWAGRGGRAVKPVELRPFAEADIDTLVAWIDSPELLWRWARATFREPLDREQIEHHLARTAGAEPELLAFMAIRRETGQPVGYVELRAIDREYRAATVDLALIAPDEPDRAGLSVGLLLEIQELAFGQMQSQRLQATVLDHDNEPRGVFKTVGFVTEKTKYESRFREDIRIMSRARDAWLEGRRTRYRRHVPPTEDSETFEDEE